MVDINDPVILDVSMSLREAALMIQGLEFWASDFAGNQDRERAALALKAAADLRAALTEKELAALREHGEL
jgi:hypothetical protein